jgi:hypothetical protein
MVKSHLHRGPTDVAAIYHYKFKSYEEFFGNKARRGSAFYGNAYNQTWTPLPNGTIYDDIAWKTLISNEPHYRYFDTFEAF